MKKSTKKTPASIIKFIVELSYISDFFSKNSNSCDFNDPDQMKKAKAAHLDDTAKKFLNSTLRANFSINIKTKNKNFLDIKTEIDRLNNDKELGVVITLSRKYQNLVLSLSKPVYPQLAGKEYPQLIEDDWSNKLKFGNKELTYSTNIYNCIDYTKVDTKEAESKLLDILQEFIDQGLSQYIEISMGYNCWYYYYKQLPCAIPNFTLQEIINHRRTHL